MKDLIDTDFTSTPWPPEKEVLKENAIRFASVVIKSGGDGVPTTPLEDEVETQLGDQARLHLSFMASDYQSGEGEVEAMRERIAISGDAPAQSLRKLLNGIATTHRHYSNSADELEADRLAAEVAVTGEETRSKHTRPPQPDTTANIIGYALGFMGVEALVTAMTFLGQTGSSGAAAAVGLAIVAAASNIGLGGYLMGSVVLPRTLRINSEPATAWMFRVIAVVSVIWIVMTNFLLAHFRASAGDFQIAFNSFLLNPINVGDMTGLLLAGFGLILASAWCVKFFYAQDRHLHYGALGERLTTAQDALRENEGAYADHIRELAEQALDELDEIADDAATGARLATDMFTTSQTLARQFEEEQQALAASASEAIIYRRSVLREMLSPYGLLPSYLAEPANVDELTRPIVDFDEISQKTDNLIKDAQAAISEAKEAREKVEKIVAQALSLPFGSAIYPATQIGGDHV